MKKQAEYIKRIEIKGLWGRKNIAWDLRPDVNILSGVNGIGKSTILTNSVRRLSDLEGGALSNGIHLGVSFTFYPEDATYIHFDVIRSFDRPLLSSGLLEKIGNQNVKTELDWQLYLLQLSGLSGEHRQPDYRASDQRQARKSGQGSRNLSA